MSPLLLCPRCKAPLYLNEFKEKECMFCGYIDHGEVPQFIKDDIAGERLSSMGQFGKQIREEKDE